MISQNGFLLSFIKYGENDAVLHCFMKEDGYQSYFLKGIYSKKNKKKSFLLPLNKLNFTIKSGRNNSIKTVSSFETIEILDLYTNIKANTVVFFVADFLNQILRNEHKNLQIYNTIEEFLHELNNQNYRSHFIFLIKILKIHGLAPLLSNEEYLNPENGTFTNVLSNHLFEVEISNLWKEILTSENSYEIKISSHLRKKLLDSILLYYHYHFTDFKTPVSLEIVQQLF